MPSDKLPTIRMEVADLNKRSMTVTYKVDPRSLHRAQMRARRLRAFPYSVRPTLQAIADYTTQSMIPRTFEQEGPGWAKLAPMTMGLRIAQGFNGPHPILYRTGDLYESLTNRSHPRHIETIRTGKNAKIAIGSTSIKFIENQLGTPRIPARPMIPGTGSYPHIPITDKDKKNMSQLAMKQLLYMMSWQ